MAAEYPDYRPDLKVRLSATEFFLSPIGEEIDAISVVDWLSLFRIRVDQEETDFVARAELVERLARLDDYATEVKLIAFYLPQYHPIPENDAWWGPGFTEWNNVSTSKPLFEGHYQPQLPADLGFYDLRLADTRKAQADLAREYGVYGFCYYYYWFSGRKILDRPLREVVESGEPDFPFCICWANESWSRRWDGSEQELLIAQEHHHETDIGFIYDILSIIEDPRYIRIDGEPLVLIYRVGIIPQPQKLFQEWKNIAKENGLPGLHICMAETFGAHGPYEYGCDSAVEFPPHRVVSELKNSKIPDIPRDYTGNIYDYREVIQNDLLQRQPPYTRFRTVMPSWDNTSRRGKSGHVFHGASPELYETWLSQVVSDVRQRLAGDKRIAFVNAWNEWAEGAHLEPDRRYGRRYLEATRRAVSGQSNWRTVLDGLELRDELDEHQLPRLVQTLKSQFTALQEANDFLSRKLKDKEIAWGQSVFTDNVPIGIANNAIVPGGRLEIDRLNQYWSGLWHVLHRHECLILHGWSFVPGLHVGSDTNSFLSLVEVSTGARFFAAVWDRIQRPDVVSATNSSDSEALWAGFRFVASLGNVPPGEYLIKMIYSGSENSFQAVSRRRLVLV
ncbi:MAG: lipopolysaccharide biosynthesis protein [Methylocystaceae bacterium]|nr:MAG: lipopolysaccharide biosynthesis protein [Methylocystaceae bacterium]